MVSQGKMKRIIVSVSVHSESFCNLMITFITIPSIASRETDRKIAEGTGRLIITKKQIIMHHQHCIHLIKFAYYIIKKDEEQNGERKKDE